MLPSGNLWLFTRRTAYTILHSAVDADRREFPRSVSCGRHEMRMESRSGKRCRFWTLKTVKERKWKWTIQSMS